MDFQASALSHRLSQQTQSLVLLGAFLAALSSLTFAAYTTPGKSFDLLPLYDMALSWVGGNYNSTLRLNLYPPATVLLLAPFALLPFKTLIVVWFTINVALTGLSVGLAIKLVGSTWPWRAKYFLLFFVMTWAPFRVTLRNGQLTILIVALLLGSLVAWRGKKPVLSGLLFGLALSKYTLTLPFIFYFAWHHQWKLISTAIGLQVAMTGIFAYRLGIDLMDIIANYLLVATRFSISAPSSTDLNSLVLGITGGHALIAMIVGFAVGILAIVSMFLILRRRPEAVNSHLALLSLFAIWPVYHRTYDFMLCMIPVAVLIDFIVNGKLVAWSGFWLAGFSMLALGVPGFMTARAGAWITSGSPLLFLMIQSERLLVIGMFWFLIFVLWKRLDQLPDQSSLLASRPVETLT